MNKAQAIWEKCKLQEVNPIDLDNQSLTLIIENSCINQTKEVVNSVFIKNQESISVGIFSTPTQFDQTYSEGQFVSDFESVRNQFDALLLINKNADFTDFGFQEMISNDELTASITLYKNSSLDFESIKAIFKSNSIVIMSSALASGSNKAMEAIIEVFEFPDFYSNKIVELKDTILYIATQNFQCSSNELNSIGNYSLKQTKSGATLNLNTSEDKTLENDIRISILQSGYDFIF